MPEKKVSVIIVNIDKQQKCYVQSKDKFLLQTETKSRQMSNFDKDRHLAKIFSILKTDVVFAGDRNTQQRTLPTENRVKEEITQRYTLILESTQIRTIALTKMIKMQRRKLLPSHQKQGRNNFSSDNKD